MFLLMEPSRPNSGCAWGVQAGRSLTSRGVSLVLGQWSLGLTDFTSSFKSHPWCMTALPVCKGFSQTYSVAKCSKFSWCMKHLSCSFSWRWSITSFSLVAGCGREGTFLVLPHLAVVSPDSLGHVVVLLVLLVLLVASWEAPCFL